MVRTQKTGNAFSAQVEKITQREQGDYGKPLSQIITAAANQPTHEIMCS